MSQVQMAVFVRTLDSRIDGSVLTGKEPKCVLTIDTESVHLDLHFDSDKALDMFMVRCSLAADAVRDAIRDPSDDTVTLGPAADPVRVGGIDLSEPVERFDPEDADDLPDHPDDPSIDPATDPIPADVTDQSPADALDI